MSPLDKQTSLGELVNGLAGSSVNTELTVSACVGIVEWCFLELACPVDIYMASVRLLRIGCPAKY